MPFNPRNANADGFKVMNAGVHSGLAPNTLPRNQSAWATNATFRTGFPETRPGWTRHPLVYANEDLRIAYQSGLFQGACAFEFANQIVVSVSGKLFAISLNDLTLQEVTVAGDPSQASIRQAWFAAANQFLVVQNGSDAAVIYDGSTSRRADPFGNAGIREVPTGTVMCYVGGRLWVTSPNRVSFAASDIIFGPTGTEQYGRADAVLRFTENTFLNEGGSFGVPLNAGLITAMAPIAQLDTATGQGPMMVFTERSIFSVGAPADRTTWKNLQYPIQAVSMIDAGATGWASVALVNSDIWYRSQDGIRSFAVGRRDFGTWVNTSQSNELTRILPLDDLGSLNFTSTAVFDNRLLVTASPQQDWTHGTWFGGIVSLDFIGVTSLGSQGRPDWEGVWTGLKTLQLISGVFQGRSRCFALALSSENLIELWELSREKRFDNKDGVDLPIICSLETGSYDWDVAWSQRQSPLMPQTHDGGWSLRQLQFGELWYDEIEGRVAFEASFRPDQDHCWQVWSSWRSCAPDETCTTVDPITGCAVTTPVTLGRQYRRRHRLPTPADTVDPVVNKPYRQADEFQIRLVWTGAVRLKKLRLWASPMPEVAFGSASNCE